MKYFKNLSYLRVIACIAIVCTHISQRLMLEGRIYELTHYMQHGVYLFFIISGFLALYTYSENNYSPVRYWIKRLARILPVYYAVVIYDIIVHGLILKDMPHDWAGLGWLRYIFIIGQYIPGENQWRNLSFTWTIGIFVLFYIMTPILARIMKTYRSSLVGLAVTYLCMIGLDILYARLEITRDWFTPLFYVLYFMFGAVACRAVQEHKADRASLLLACIMLYFFAMSKFNSPYTLSCLFTIIVLASMNIEFKNSYVTKMFDVLDRFSYEIYLGHAVVMEIIDMLMASYILPEAAITGIAVVGTAIVSVALYYGVDRPVNAFIRRRT